MTFAVDEAVRHRSVGAKEQNGVVVDGYHPSMADLALDLDDRDAIDFVHYLQPILAGALRQAAAPDAYVVKLDSWFGASWLGFSFKAPGRLGVSNRRTLRVPPFVPTRVVSQRFYRRAPSGRYEAGPAPVTLHIVQTSEDNQRRLMSAVCPGAAALWWSGSSRPNQRACAMSYLPSDDGHVAWYAEFQRTRRHRNGASASPAAPRRPTSSTPPFATC